MPKPHFKTGKKEKRCTRVIDSTKVENLRLGDKKKKSLRVYKMKWRTAMWSYSKVQYFRLNTRIPWKKTNIYINHPNVEKIKLG